MKTNSILTLADSYKYAHAFQYPENMVSMFDYMASRGGVYSHVVPVGLSYYLQEYISQPVTLEQIQRTATMADSHGVPFDHAGWLHILTKHDGILPLRIMAIPEGTVLPVGLTKLTVESTDSAVPWLAGFVETILMMTYYPTMVATKSYHIKQMLLKYGSPEWAQFALHNFGNRACHCPESAALSGFAHATQFLGTDNFNSLFFMEDYYGQPEGQAACYSVWASEHSSTTSNCSGTTAEERLAQEEDFVYRMLLANPGRSIMSFVADSTDVYAFTEFCTAPGSRIRLLVESRPHQKLVLRPDSGDPIEVLSGMLSIMLNNKIAVLPKDQGADKLLFIDFGLLWGDGIDTAGIRDILQWFTKHDSPNRAIFAAENFVFGMGGGLATVDMHRDTSKYAIKCSSITVDEGSAVDTGNGHETGVHTEWEPFLVDIDVYKDPITDPGKASKRGKRTTWYDTEAKEYIDGVVGEQPNMHCVDALIEVYNNGVLSNQPTMDSIRAI